MAVTFYLTPMIVGPVQGGLESSYLDAAAPSTPRGNMRVGREPFCILGVTDIDPAVDAAIAADPTCTKIPPLTNTVGAGALANVKAKIEGIGIPADWVTAGMTYQTVLSTCMRVTQLYQRLQGLGAARLLDSGVTLDTTFGSLPVNMRNKMLQMANEFNFNTSSLSGASTIRQILKALADQWVGPILCCGVIF